MGKSRRIEKKKERGLQIQNTDKVQQTEAGGMSWLKNWL